VLGRFPLEERALQRNRLEDVVRYMDAWADLLAEQLQPKLEQAANPAPEAGQARARARAA